MKNKNSITHLTRLCLCALLAVVCFNSYSQTTKKAPDSLKIKPMETIYYSKKLDVYIDFSKIVEITGLDKYPKLKTGFYNLSKDNREWFDKQGQYYFTIKYQLKTNVKHFLSEPDKNEYYNIINKWKQFSNNR